MPSHAKNSTTPAKIQARERQAQALELRKAGADYKRIAETLGYASPAGAYQAVKAALGRMMEEGAQQLRIVHYERLNNLLVTLWPRAVKGDMAALDRTLAIMDRIARLYGVDAPVAATSTESREVIVIDGDKSQYIESLKQIRRQRSANGNAQNFNGAADSDGSHGAGSEKSAGAEREVLSLGSGDDDDESSTDIEDAIIEADELLSDEREPDQQELERILGSPADSDTDIDEELITLGDHEIDIDPLPDADDHGSHGE